jgi:hypothetical protein
MRYHYCFPLPVDALLGAENCVFRVRDVGGTTTLPTLEHALYGLFTITINIILMGTQTVILPEYI